MIKMACFLNAVKFIGASFKLHRSYFVSRNRQSGPFSGPGANLIATPYRYYFGTPVVINTSGDYGRYSEQPRPVSVQTLNTG